jgi:hypothetical protein
MSPKPKRSRTARREAARVAADVARDRERLFKLSAGGRSEAPLDVSSASVVEIRAASVACPRCDGEQIVDEHVAVASSDGARLREVRLQCRRCGSKRSMWFRLPMVN